MATDLERLVVTLEASITKYERSMNKALGVSNARAKQVEARWAKLNLGQNAFVGFAKGAITGLVPVLSLAAAIGGAKNALKEFGDIADNAKASGLDPELFQSLAYQVSLSGVSFEEAASALGTFAKNSGLAVEGKGKMVAALKALNPALLENIRSATSQAERVRLVADALRDAKSASERAAIATAAFGEAGLKMGDALRGGAAAIDETMQKAKALGIIVDRDLIKRADKLGDEFDTATKVLDLQFKQILVELAPILTQVAGAVADLIRQLRGLGTVKTFDPSAALRKAREDLDFWTSKKDKGWLEAIFDPGDIAQIDSRIKGAQALVDDLTTPRARGPRGRGHGGTPAAAPASPVLTLDEIDTQNEAAAAAIKHGKAVKALIADLEFENKIVGLSKVDQEVMNATRQAGVDVMSEEGLRIRELIVLTNEQREAQDKLNETTQLYDDIAQQAGRSLVDAFKDGKVEGKELLGILADVVRQLAIAGLKDAATNGNIGASILTGILSGFASGTSNTGGARGEVRGIVHGQEAVIPLPSGGRIPVEVRMPRLAESGGAGRGKVTNNVFNYGNGQVRTESNASGGIDVIVAETERQIQDHMARGRYRHLGVGPGRRRS